MTNEAPPREFWINKRELDTNGIPFVAQGKPDDEFILVSGVYHLIEYRAYQALKEENERLKKSLDSLRIAHRYEVAETVHAAKRALDFSAGEKLKLHDRITQLGQEILKLTGIKIKELEI
jgi:hypothetical protein